MIERLIKLLSFIYICLLFNLLNAFAFELETHVVPLSFVFDCFSSKFDRESVLELIFVCNGRTGGVFGWQELASQSANVFECLNFSCIDFELIIKNYFEYSLLVFLLLDDFRGILYESSFEVLWVFMTKGQHEFFLFSVRDCGKYREIILNSHEWG